jgi:hypothetical protein
MKNLAVIAIMLMLAACGSQQTEKEKQKELEETQSIPAHIKTDEERMDSMKKALGIDTLMADTLE